MKKHTIKEFAEGKKAVKIENEEQWNKLNKVHKLCTIDSRNIGHYFNNIHEWCEKDWYERNGYETLEFSQLDFEDEFVAGKWYKRVEKEDYLYQPRYVYYVKCDSTNKKEKGILNYSERINFGGAHTYYNDYCETDNFIQIDPSEIQQFLPLNHPDLMKKDTFVLPEFWHVVVTEENKEVLSRWRFHDQPSLNLDSYIEGIVGLLPKYPNSRNHNTSKDKDWNRSIEITFEEFKTHVLKESTMQKIKEGSQFKVSGESANTIYTFNRIEGDDVDVTWGTTHHVHYYLSTCLANIKDGSWILINKEKTMEKEIIGYKFKEQYLKYQVYAAQIGNYNTHYDVQQYYLKEKDNILGNAINLLKEAGVLDLWFEPVYKEEFKVGEWISFSNAARTKTITSKLKEWTAHNYCILENGEKPFKDIIRKSTLEEIKAAQIQLPTINGYSGSYENGIIKYGCAEFSKMFFEHLNSTNSHLGNRTIKSIKLSSDVEISIEEIKQIVEYINNK